VGRMRVDSGLARGDKRIASNDGQRPHFRGVRVVLGTGYTHVRDWAAVETDLTEFFFVRIKHWTSPSILS
jgi:hypothetical protein